MKKHFFAGRSYNQLLFQKSPVGVDGLQKRLGNWILWLAVFLPSGDSEKEAGYMTDQQRTVTIQGNPTV